MAKLKNTIVSDTGSIQLPSGTSAQRTITAFTNVGTYSWTAPTGVTKIQILVVAGGGGGGGGATNADGNGGGGAGGVVYNSAYTVVPGQAYSIIVGDGGAGGAQVANSRGTNGSNSQFYLTASGAGSGINAVGGGGGGSDTTQAGLAGGSGGGAGVSGSSTPYAGGAGTVGQGFAGGSVTVGGAGPGGGGAGGGGAGGVGGNGAQLSNGANGGVGVIYAISGTSTWYAGGGAGSSWTNYGGIGGPGGGGNGASRPSAYAANNGVPNTGGGGGAGAATYSSGTGGSGIVIINYNVEVVQVYSTVGTYSWTAPSDVKSIELLVVGGGGGGGGAYVGGGGGAGGLQYSSNYTVVPGNSYSITVGAGGAGGAGGIGNKGVSGSSSVFDTVTALGGGGGGSYSTNVAGISGGSGGGGSYLGGAGAGTSGQGFDGASGAATPNRGGGGGGAGGAGNNLGGLVPASNNFNSGGAGGPGLPYSITGTTQWYAAGGGGGSDAYGGAGGQGGGGAGGGGTSATGGGRDGSASGSTVGRDAVPGTGSGGGGAGGAVSTLTGGAGASGIVIIKYNGISNTASNTQGLVRYNSTTAVNEVYTGKAQWTSLVPSNDIVASGLWFHVDAGNKNSKVFYASKILNDNVWNLGSTDTGQFSLNGNTNENFRIVDNDPWGNRAIIWEGRSSGDGNADGGWNTSFFSINPYIPYRFTQWLRRTTSGYTAVGGGSSYFGTNNVRDASGLSNNGNPYFFAGGWPYQHNQWYLLVAHVFPANRASGQTNPHPDSGWYTVENGGAQLNNSMTDYVLRTDATTINQRTYLYYTADSITRQQFYRPRVDALDGTEPSIQQLLRDDPVDPDIWYDMQGTNHQIMWNGMTYDSDGGGSMTFNGSNQYSQTSISTQQSFPNGGSFEMWFKINAKNTNHGFMSIVNTPTYLNFYMPTTNKLRWEVIGNTGSTYNAIFTNMTFEPGRWYHAVGTFDPVAQTTSIYINGVFENSQTGYTNMPGNASYSAPVALGNYGGNLNGKIAIARVYTKPLTAAEIHQNFTAQRSRFGI